MAATISMEVGTKMAENHTQDGRFKCQFEKMEVLQFFLSAKPSVLLRNSVLGLKVNQAWQLGQAGSMLNYEKERSVKRSHLRPFSIGPFI